MAVEWVALAVQAAPKKALPMQAAGKAAQVQAAAKVPVRLVERVQAGQVQAAQEPEEVTPVCRICRQKLEQPHKEKTRRNRPSLSVSAWPSPTDRRGRRRGKP